MRLPNLSSRPFLDTRPVWIVTAVGALLGLVLASYNAHLYFNASGQISELLERRDRLRVERDQIYDQVQKTIGSARGLPVSTLGNRITSVNKIVDGHRFSWLRLLDDLAEAMPYDLRLISLSPRLGKAGEVRLELNGVAKTREDLIGLLEGLIRHPKFAEPIPNSESGRAETRSGGLEFNIGVIYFPDGSTVGGAT